MTNLNENNQIKFVFENAVTFNDNDVNRHNDYTIPVSLANKVQNDIKRFARKHNVKDPLCGSKIIYLKAGDLTEKQLNRHHNIGKLLSLNVTAVVTQGQTTMVFNLYSKPELKD